MNFKKAIIIPVFIYTEEERKLAELDLDISENLGLENTEERAFWSIDSAYRYEYTEYSAFYSGGACFVCPFSKEKLIELINNHSL